MLKFLIWLFKGFRKKRSDISFFSKGLFKDDEDSRDYVFSSEVEELPKQLLLRVPDVKNQLSIGSCGSHAFTSAYEIMNPDVALSELFHYYETRRMAENLPEDSGMTLRDGAKSFAKTGCCIEFFWRYKPSYFNVKPNVMSYRCAELFKISNYYRVVGLDDVKKALINGLPVVGGWQIFTSFYSYNPRSYQNGIYNKVRTDKPCGGHAMVITGFDEDKKAFRVLNSWGRNWGDGGFVWISYKFFEDYCFDAWIIQ